MLSARTPWVDNDTDSFADVLIENCSKLVGGKKLTGREQSRSTRTPPSGSPKAHKRQGSSKGELMSPETTIRPRDDTTLPGRFASSAASGGSRMPTNVLADWLAHHRTAHPFRVTRIPFDELEGWSFEHSSGNIVHESGKFFTVEGLDVVVGEGPFPEWQQPIIVQPEVGILGFLTKEFDGVLHFLVQAKMEPGNPNLLQLSPTVQATRSNYTKVHQGAGVKYLDYFVKRGRGRVLADVLQSEHGSWFFRKSNRNMIVEAFDDVPVDEGFCWLTLGQIGDLLRHDHLVNMDARTVLACAPVENLEAGALHSDTELLSWFTAERARYEVRVRRISLEKVSDWLPGAYSIQHRLGHYFQVMAVSVRAGSREVSGWTQPLFEPIRPAIAAFVTRRIDGVPHLLAHARVEPGFRDTVELGPTIQCTPEYYEHLPEQHRPPFLDLVREAGRGRIRYEAMHAEEGGRFYHANSRYLIVEADEGEVPPEPPSGYRWVTPGQLNSLVRHGGYVNVQARSLLSVLNARAVQL